MKKSEIYHLAQLAVVSTPAIAPETKIEVMRVLLDDESLALFVEKEREKENAETV